MVLAHVLLTNESDDAGSWINSLQQPPQQQPTRKHQKMLQSCRKEATKTRKAATEPKAKATPKP